MTRISWPRGNMLGWEELLWRNQPRFVAQSQDCVSYGCKIFCPESGSFSIRLVRRQTTREIGQMQMWVHCPFWSFNKAKLDMLIRILFLHHIIILYIHELIRINFIRIYLLQRNKDSLRLVVPGSLLNSWKRFLEAPWFRFFLATRYRGFKF